MKWGEFFRLMRCHKPVGTLLLWFPTAWALWIASPTHSPPAMLIFYFALGTMVMRAAGCIINDMADMPFDKHVKRTAMRPLTTGALSLQEASGLLIILLLIAFIIVLQLPALSIYESMVALWITIFYPFCKRFFHAPQLVLGLAFSMGIPMAFAASGVSQSRDLFVLMLLNFCWIVAYDTMYALSDKADDLKLGLHSTAIFFGSYARVIIFALQVLGHSLWFFVKNETFGVIFYVSFGMGALIIFHQQRLLQRGLWMKAFNSCVWYGLVMWLAVV